MLELLERPAVEVAPLLVGGLRTVYKPQVAKEPR